MTLQQQHIVDTIGKDLAAAVSDEAPPPIYVVQAYAGTGKTTTCHMLARANPKTRFLYLVFGRDAQEEAQRRFGRDCRNVEVRTFDAFARSAIAEQRDVGGNLNCATLLQHFGDLITPRNVRDTWSDLQKFLQDPLQVRPHTVTAQMVWDRVRDSRRAAHSYFNVIRRMFYERLTAPDSSGYALRWSRRVHQMVILDECQDLDPVMMRSALLYSGPILFIGDTYQHIYDFSGMCNAFEFFEELSSSSASALGGGDGGDGVGGPRRPVLDNRPVVRLHLTESFRFGPVIARRAREWLEEHFSSLAASPRTIDIAAYDTTRDDGVLLQTRDSLESHPEQFGCAQVAILCAHNSSIIPIVLRLAGKRIHVLGKRILVERIREQYRDFCGVRPVARAIEHFKAMLGRLMDDENYEKASVLAIVLDYHERLPDILDSIDAQHCETMSEARYVVGTIYRSKGLEFDGVVLVDDFELAKKINTVAEKIEQAHHRKNSELLLSKGSRKRRRPVDQGRIETVNYLKIKQRVTDDFTAKKHRLYYVGITRARKALFFRPLKEGGVATTNK